MDAALRPSPPSAPAKERVRIGGQSQGPRVGRGGIFNTNSGLGGVGDKSVGAAFSPTRFFWRRPIDIIFVQSWAARKALRLPVDDSLLRWREWSDGDVDGAAEKMMEAEERHAVRSILADGMVAGAAYGTAVIVMVTKEAPLEEPLMIERIRPGDLAAMHVFDRYDLSVVQRDSDLMSPGYRRASMFRVTPSFHGGKPFVIHASRCLRFDPLMVAISMAVSAEPASGS